MHIRILGSAAGGGVPQWNCRCWNCEAARAGDGKVLPRTQSSVAVSADGVWWFLLNVSPDVRRQILDFPPLGGPPGQCRGTSIAGCLLTDAEIDHTGGMLTLRESGRFNFFSTAVVHRWLNCELPLERLLGSFGPVSWRDLPLNIPVYLSLPDGKSSGLEVHALEVDRHVPRYVSSWSGKAEGAVIGLRVRDIRTGGRLVYTPCLACASPALAAAVPYADCVLIDGTFWSDDEPIRFGLGGRTARDMGHWPVGGADGSLEWLGSLPIAHRVYVHINNTNPMLHVRGPEARQVAERGVRIGADGDMFEL